MARVLTICNKKGGCGKTTSSVNLAAALAIRFHRVLLLDLDPQAHTTLSLGHSHRDGDELSAALTGDGSLEDLVCRSGLNLLDFVPGTTGLMTYQKENYRNSAARTILAEKLSPLQRGYDFIIVDTPPTLGLLTASALIASEEVYIPMQMDYLGFDALPDIVRMIYTINHRYNPKLRLGGIIPTFYRGRTRIARAVVTQTRRNLGSAKIMHPVRVNVSLAEAPGSGKSIFEYNPDSSGARDYDFIAAQIAGAESA